MERTTKYLVIALVVSASLNVFFVGFAAGRRHLHGGPGAHAGGPPPPGLELGPRGFLRRAGLRDAGPEVERVIEARREALRARRDAIEAVRGRVAEALRAEPFDADRFSATLTELRTETTQMQTQMHAAFVDVAKSLTPQQRQQLARAPWFLHEPR